MVKIDKAGPRATITIDDPERRNPLSAQVVTDLIAATIEANDDPEVRVLVYTGAGDRAFSAGGDLSAGFFDDPVANHRARGELVDLFRAMWDGEKPTVARVNGHALAGGFGLAVACDITICVDDARLGTPEVGVGLWPMMISVPLLRAVGAKALFELMATGRTITPAEALDLGAVSRVVERGQLDCGGRRNGRGAGQPRAQRQSLGDEALLRAIAGMSPLDALDYLHSGLTALTLTEDAQEGCALSPRSDPRLGSGGRSPLEKGPPGVACPGASDTCGCWVGA